MARHRREISRAYIPAGSQAAKKSKLSRIAWGSMRRRSGARGHLEDHGFLLTNAMGKTRVIFRGPTSGIETLVC